LIGEGDGTSLQYSCLENPMDGGAWWAAVPGVVKSQTRLKRLSSSSSSTRVHMWDCYFLGQNKVIQEITSARRGKPRNHIPARPRILEITANS